ncbi:MAG: nucleotidyltransferase domain-containing protein [Kiritimatiellae bacterium]|nr:nucleotidyltransferase domain-containing protein [Kiritimatiellia bacterium]
MILEKIFGSKGRAALLRTLFDRSRSRTHIREIASAANLSAPSLMREAKSLVKIGLLREESNGNRVDYFANTESPLYAPLVEIVEKTCGPQILLAKVFSDCDAPVVFIYGSRAKGAERIDSDYDLFVIGNEGLRKVSSRIMEVSGKIDAEINPYVITPEEFRRRLGSGDHFLSEVIASPKLFLKGGESELARLE